MAAGNIQTEAFDKQLAALDVVQRRKVTLLALDPWDDEESYLPTLFSL